MKRPPNHEPGVVTKFLRKRIKPETMSSYWDVPKMWEGCDVVIIGGGHSLANYDWERFQELKKQHGFKVIGTNDAFRLGSWVDICFFGDSGFWLDRKELLAKYTGLIVSCFDELAIDPPIPWVRVVRRDRSRPFYGLANEKAQGRDTIKFNTNSGMAAINLACLLGVHRILLLGFDMGVSTDQETGVSFHHWHNHHIKTPCLENYTAWLNYFTKMKKDLARKKVECLALKPSKLVDVHGIRGLERIEDAF